MRAGYHRVYPNIAKRGTLWGLELVDLFGLVFFYGILSAFSLKLPMKILFVLLGLMGLKLFKRGKPNGYFSNLITYLRSPKMFSPFMKRDPIDLTLRKDGHDADKIEKN